MISTYKNIKQIFSFAIALFLLLGVPLLFPLSSYAAINETFNFQAKLTNTNGTNVADGTYNFRFSIYDASAAGNCLWTSKGTIPGSGSCTYAGGSPGTDLVAVTVTNGLFNVNLGTSAGGLTDFENVSAALAKFSNNSLYLDIQVYNGSSWETFGSRKLLESVPYAFRAKYADTSTNVPLSGITAATTTNTIDNLLNAQTWNWSTLSTQTALSYSANSLTTGTILGISSSTTAASASGDLVKFELTGNSTNVTGNALKVGVTGATATAVALNVTNGGTGFSFLVNDDGTYSDASPFSINASGDVGIGTTTPDSALEVKNSGFPQLTLRNGGSVRLWIGNDLTDFIFKTSYDYNLSSWKFRSNNNDDVVTINTAAPVGSLFIDSAGNVGLQDITPASAFTVGNGDLFQVNSTGNIVKINNVTTSFPGSQGGTNTVLQNDGSGGLTWSSSLTGVTIPISKLAVAAATNTIDNTLYAQQWDWSTLSTQNALTLTGNGISTGNLLSLTSTSTALTSSSLLNILSTGDPAASWTGALAKVEYTTSTDVDINGDILRVGVTGAGAGQGTTLNITSAQTGTNALAFRVNDDGTYSDSTPFVVDKAGNVGIGTTTPKAALHSLVGTTGTMAFPYESAAFENSGDNKVGVFTSGAAFGNGAALTFGDSKATNGSGRIPGFELQYIGNTASTSTYIRLNYLERDSTAGTVTASAANLFNVFGGAATANGRVAIIGGGNSYNTFSVGASGEFQVDSSGNIVKINNVTTSFPASQGGSNTYLKNNGSGVLTWDTVSASASISTLTLAGGTNTIDNTLYAQQWDWSTLSTQNALTLTSNGITTGNLLSLSSTSTALTSSSLLNILATGNPAASWTGALAKVEYTTSTDADINGDGLRVGITGAGAGQGTSLNITSAQTGTSALAFRVNDDGTYSDSSPFIIDKDGNVGLGVTSVTSARLNIDNTLRLVTSGTPEAGYLFGTSIPSGSITEGSGQLLSYGINVQQLGTRDTGKVGGIFRLDTRSGYEAESFAIIGSPAGGSTQYSRLSVNLANGDTYIAPTSGNVTIGSSTLTSMFNVGSSAQFQVNSSGQIAAAAGIISSGTIQFSALTTNGALYTSSSNGTLTTTAPTSGAIGYWSRTSTTLSPTTANDILSIANTTTTGADFAITNTGVYTGTGIFNLTANSATTGQLALLSGTSLTTGDVLKITGGSAMTTGNDLHLNGATYVHGANSEVGSLAQFEFSDTTSGAYTSTTNGILMQPTINITAGAANKTINGISVAPTFTACTTATCTVNGLNVADVTDSGNFNSTGLKIGTGWDEAIRANGSVVIGAQTDSASTGSSTYTLINSAAGTFVTSTDVSMDKISAAAVYEGKLFVATAEPSAAAVYRYDGGTTWVRVTSTTLGRVLSTDTTVVDGYAMTVFDGKLWIGSQTGADNLAGVYWSTTADTASAGDNFTMVNSARGTINAATTAGISSMVVFYGNLIVATQKTDAADITRYDGGTTFTKINTTGKSAAETAADKDAFNLVVCGNLLYNGSISGTTTGVVASTTGNGTTWINTTVVATGGNFGAETVTSDIDSMVCYNGTLYISTSKTGGNSAAIYYYKATANPVSAVAANWVRINVAVGKMLNADSAVIDKFILRVYNGRLYAGSQTATGDAAGALFEYTGIPLADWTLMSTGARGTFGSQTSIDSISALIEFNGTLYVGTDDLTAGVGSVYTWSKTAQNSFALKFISSAAAGENYGAISFMGEAQSSSNLGHTGSFIFSNSVQLDAGAFDYAEDYPTRDSSLNAGELVTVDKNNAGNVVRSSEGSSVIGIVSKTPGFRLSSKEKLPDGAYWIPIALVGRVPLKVTSSNGTIQIGDRISSSSIKGVGMKSTGSGDTVGVALESFSVTDPNVIGEITVFVDLNYSDTHISKEEFEEYSVASLENTLDGTKTYSVSNLDSTKSINELGLYDQIKAGSITSGLLNTTDLTVNGINFTSYITNLNTKLALLQPQTENVLVPTVKKEETPSNISSDISSENKSDTNSEFDLLKKQLISMIDDKFSSLSSVNTINTDVLGDSSTNINLLKLNTFSSKINILEDGSIEVLGNIKFSDLLNVDSIKTKKISAYSGSDLIAELSDNTGKSKFSIFSLGGKELFSVDSTGETSIYGNLNVKGDLNISGKISGEGVFESKWIEISPNSEVIIKHGLNVIPRSINVLRASESDCETSGGELDCTNVTNEGFGNKDVYFYKNLDKSSLKVVNALSDKIFVKVFVTK